MSKEAFRIRKQFIQFQIAWKRNMNNYKSISKRSQSIYHVYKPQFDEDSNGNQNELYTITGKPEIKVKY